MKFSKDWGWTIIMASILISCNLGHETDLVSDREVTTTDYASNALNDTTLIGTEIIAKGRKMSVEDVFEIKVIDAGKPEVIPANQNIIPEKSIAQNALVIDPTDWKIVDSNTIESPKPLVNSLGDTIPTGVSIPAVGRRVTVKWPKPVAASLPRYRDNITVDVKFLGIEQGMSSNWIHSLIQDRRGNFWFGSYGGGASLYNGVSFYHFTPEHGLIDEVVLKIFEDSKGRIWFGTDGGLVYFDGVEFVQFLEEDGLASNNINSIIEDEEGNLWFGSWFYGLSKYDGESITYYSEKEGIASNRIVKLCNGNNRKIWFGTLTNELYNFNGLNFSKLFSDEFMNEIGPIYAIHEDAEENLWIGTKEDSYVLSGDQLIKYPKDKVLSAVIDIDSDREGNIWFGSEHSGIVKYDGENFTRIGVEEGINNSVIKEILIDELGKVWFTTYGGIHIYNPHSFQHPKIFSNKIIRSMVEDREGNIWWVTNNSGVYRYNGKNYYRYSSSQGLFKRNSSIWTIYEDGKGNIWFGASVGDGLIQFNGQEFTHYIPRNPEKYHYAEYIFEDRNNHLWVSYQGVGLIKLLEKTIYEYSTTEGFVTNYLQPPMVNDSHGNFLVLNSSGGFTFVNPGDTNEDNVTLTHFLNGDKTPLKFTNMVVDQYNNHWITDEKGNVFLLNRSENDVQIKHLSQSNVRDRKRIRSLVLDKEGGVWIGSTDGLDRLNLDTKKQPESFSSGTRYRLQDGLKSSIFFTSALVNQDNIAWWSTGDGVTKLDLNQKRFSESVPSLDFTGVSVNEQLQDFRNLSEEYIKDIDFEGIESFRNIPTSLELGYHLNTLTFHFAALDWSAPHHIRYSYYLEGLSQDWSSPSPDASASFQRLPPGDYRLLVKTVGSNSQWSDPVSYSFTIQTPFWLTWWAKVIYVIVAILFVYALIQWRTRNLKRTRDQLLDYQDRLKGLSKQLAQNEETQRKEIASDLHDSVGQLLASSRLQIAAVNDEMEKTEIMDKVKNISYGLKEAVQATRKAIFDLYPPQLNEMGLFPALEEWMKSELKEKHNIHYSIKGEVQKYEIRSEIRHLLFRCVRELLNNVMKHAEATLVEVITQDQDGFLVITVQDNGKGFENDPDPVNKSYSGFGLFSIIEKIESIGGTTSIVTQPGVGARITIKIPYEVNENE